MLTPENMEVLCKMAYDGARDDGGRAFARLMQDELVKMTAESNRAQAKETHAAITARAKTELEQEVRERVEKEIAERIAAQAAEVHELAQAITPELPKAEVLPPPSQNGAEKKPKP